MFNFNWAVCLYGFIYLLYLSIFKELQIIIY